MTGDQPTLWDNPQKAVNAQFRHDAYLAVSWCASQFREFTANEVWARLQEVAHATEPRNLGVVIRKAAAQGLIAKTDRSVPSVLPRQHGRPVPVWRSLVFHRLAK